MLVSAQENLHHSARATWNVANSLRFKASSLHLVFWFDFSEIPKLLSPDIAMGDSGVRRSIVSQLSSDFPGVYTDDNIAFVGTHQHSGVGGFLENLLPQITALGYVKETADAIVTGTVRAVTQAHESLRPGQLSVGNTTILDANINRSPTAYLANPAEERERYQYDQDKDMSLLRFDDESGTARGFISFFAVHGTSLYEVRNDSLTS
jgi:neutral ceramidase